MTDTSKPENKEWPLWEVFLQPKSGAHHAHVGSVHAPDAEIALQNARDVYTRRQEGTCIWVVPAEAITSSQPDDENSFFDPADDKIYRHPNFYTLPSEVKGL
ncbi:MAG: 1,2-phenylacetyl-CoA epoxidase subunit B [Bacteroidia bacterium]|nr:1,2-phenylacetyl-CoA epoxidase subunit B [Bacteroidia bacterium]